MSNLPPLEASVDVAAPPHRAWAAVSDLKAMSRRSPELVGTWLLGRPRVGTRAVNLNRRTWSVWPTISRITRWKPSGHDDGRGALAFHVWPTDVEWSYEIEPTATGVVLTERRTAVIDPPKVVELTARLALGGQAGHDVELAAGMHQTLAAIKAELEH